MDYSKGKIKLDFIANQTQDKFSEEPFYLDKNIFVEAGGVSATIDQHMQAVQSAMQNIATLTDSSLTASHLIYDTTLD